MSHNVVVVVLCVCLATQLCSTLLRPQGLQPARLLCPWDFPGKNTGVGCHVLFQGTFQTQGRNWSLAFLALTGKFFTTEPPEKPYISQRLEKIVTTLCKESNSTCYLLARL